MKNALSLPLIRLFLFLLYLLPFFLHLFLPFFFFFFPFHHVYYERRRSAGPFRITVNDNELDSSASGSFYRSKARKKRVALGIPRTLFAVATFHGMPIECGLRCSRFHGIVLRIVRPIRPWRSSSAARRSKFPLRSMSKISETKRHFNFPRTAIVPLVLEKWRKNKNVVVEG